MVDNSKKLEMDCLESLCLSGIQGFIVFHIQWIVVHKKQNECLGANDVDNVDYFLESR